MRLDTKMARISGVSVQERKEEILKFINDSISNNGYPPTVREICREFGFSSSSTAHAYINKLRAEGLLSSEPDKVRTWKVETERYRKKKDVLEVKGDNISIAFEIDKESIAILNDYCVQKGMNANEALRQAIRELSKLMV
jgi:SOS-response transcriptional repressor LexA